jgi:hypothetical protein
MAGAKLLLWLACAGCTAVLSAQQSTIVIKPKAFDGVLVNPGIGFTTFQRFNGDALNAGVQWTEGSPIVYQPFDGSTENKDYPATTIAYLRLYWKFIEPEEGVYRWDLIDRALQTAHQRGQTLMLRIAPYGIGPESDVPAWYRSITGEAPHGADTQKATRSWYSPLPSDRPSWRPQDPRWAVDPMNPAYAYYFGEMIRALGARYDGNPDLNVVDVSIVGAWGEGSGTALLSKDVRLALLDSYLDAFHKTQLVVQPGSPQTDAYVLSKAHVGWRADCLGDMGGFDPNWNHMTDFYPEAIIGGGLADAWKKAPVTMEACWVMQVWKNHGWDVNYIMDQAIKWHVSSFNAKSSAVPQEWWPEVNRWLTRMGYRFALRRFTYPSSIEANHQLAFTSWWENQGDAPCYQQFPLALRLRNERHSAVMVTAADIRNWMPGDSLYNDSVYIPADLPDGDYDLSIAMVDRDTREPRVKLAIAGMEKDGWYALGKIKIHQALPASQPK